MPAATLPALVAMLMVSYADGQDGPDIPDGRQGELGMTDLQIWEAIWSPEGDPMGGMRFAEACAQDPRRIDALIQQRVLVRFFGLIQAARGEQPQQMMRDSYLLRNSGIRAANNGAITSMGMAEDMRLSWDGIGDHPWRGEGELAGYRHLFSHGLWPMADAGRQEVLAIQQVIVDNSQDIFRAFKEAAALAMRAAMTCERPEDQEAWQIMHGVVTAMWDTLSRRLMDLGTPVANEDWTLPDSDLEASLPGVRFAGSGSYFPSGHRAPDQRSLPQWRRSGGRHF